MSKPTCDIRESVRELDERATFETSKSVLNRLAVLKLYTLFIEAGEASPVEYAASALGVTVETVDRWLSVYAERGLEGLLAYGRQPVSSPALSTGKARSGSAAGTRARKGAPVKRKTTSAKAAKREAATAKTVTRKSAPAKTTEQKVASTKTAKRKAASAKTAKRKVASAKTVTRKGASAKTVKRKAASAKTATRETASVKTVTREAESSKTAEQKAAFTKKAAARPAAVHGRAESLPLDTRPQLAQPDDRGDSFADQFRQFKSKTGSERDGSDAILGEGESAKAVPESGTSEAPSVRKKPARRNGLGVLVRSARSRVRRSRLALARRRGARASNQAAEAEISRSKTDTDQAETGAPSTRYLPNRATAHGRSFASGTPSGSQPVDRDPRSSRAKDSDQADRRQPADASNEGSSVIVPRSDYRPDRKYSAPTGHAFVGARVLIAEADGLITDIIQHRLEKQGADVTTATDGVEVVSRFWSTRFDLVVAAAALPGLDGFEIARWLRQNDRNKTVPILLTAWPGNESDLVRAFEAGADDFLRKPFSPSELVARSRRLLERVGGWTTKATKEPLSKAGSESSDA